MNEQRALLDKLMGRDRNSVVKNKNTITKTRRYDDRDVCQFFLAGLCPHELFKNTKSDLGACPSIHDHDALRDFARQSRNKKKHVEKRALRYYYELVEEAERKVRRAHNRLAMGAASTSKHAAMISQYEIQRRHREKQMDRLEDQIEELEEEIETLGESGRVKEALRKEQILNQVKTTLNRLNNAVVSLPKLGDERLEVCSICGGFRDGVDQKHDEGKQHTGFKKIREKVQEVEESHDRDKNTSQSSGRSSSSSRSSSRSSSSRSRSRSRSYR